jgi:ppGpp synthetase/RelA/SpoT-type nucleotidyltranferase
MEMFVKPEIFFLSLMSALLAVVAYFLKQLHTDFKRVEKDVTEVKTTTALIKTEFKGINDLMNQKIEFLEKRVSHFESIIFKQKEHGKERNEFG